MVEHIIRALIAYTTQLAKYPLVLYVKPLNKVLFTSTHPTSFGLK